MSISSIYINSSSRSSTSSSIPAADLVAKLNKNLICSCVVGVCSIKFSSLNKNIAHSALLLLPVDCDNNEGELGILIEYGDYNKNMGESEEKYVNDELVIYNDENEGGLRYYIKIYEEFRKEFGDIGIIELDLDEDKHITFDYFMEQVNRNKSKWIQKNYSSINNNCQDFVVEALKILEPKFTFNNVKPWNESKNMPKKERIKFVPEKIMSVLEDLKKNKK